MAVFEENISYICNERKNVKIKANDSSGKKGSLVKSVLDDSVDEVVSDELDLFFQSLRQNKTTDYPCRYSVNEVREGVERSVKQVDADIYLSCGEVKNRHKRP